MFSIEKDSAEPPPCVVDSWANGQVAAWLELQQVPSLSPGKGNLENRM